MAPRKNKGRGFRKNCTNTKESTFTLGIPGLEDFHFECGRHNSAAKFKESFLKLANHVVWTIDCGWDKLPAIIQNIQMVVIFVTDYVADHVS